MGFLGSINSVITYLHLYRHLYWFKGSNVYLKLQPHLTM